jgi:hypothetical protein
VCIDCGVVVSVSARASLSKRVDTTYTRDVRCAICLVRAFPRVLVCGKELEEARGLGSERLFGAITSMLVTTDIWASEDAKGPPHLKLHQFENVDRLSRDDLGKLTLWFWRKQALPMIARAAAGESRKTQSSLRRLAIMKKQQQRGRGRPMDSSFIFEGRVERDAGNSNSPGKRKKRSGCGDRSRNSQAGSMAMATNNPKMHSDADFFDKDRSDDDDDDDDNEDDKNNNNNNNNNDGDGDDGSDDEIVTRGTKRKRDSLTVERGATQLL